VVGGWSSQWSDFVREWGKSLIGDWLVYGTRRKWKKGASSGSNLSFVRITGWYKPWWWIPELLTSPSFAFWELYQTIERQKWNGWGSEVKCSAIASPRVRISINFLERPRSRYQHGHHDWKMMRDRERGLCMLGILAGENGGKYRSVATDWKLITQSVNGCSSIAQPQKTLPAVFWRKGALISLCRIKVLSVSMIWICCNRDTGPDISIGGSHHNERSQYIHSKVLCLVARWLHYPWVISS
jgi:hypothetical protein